MSVVVADRLTRLPPADLPATSDSGQGGRQAGDALALPGLGQPPGGLNSCEAAQTSSAWPVRFGAVPPLASCFQDRDLAGSLARHLEQGDTVVLTGIDLSGTQVLAGLGGVGKTQLAADHAHRLWTHRRLDLLAWITAGSRRDIQVAYAGVAARVLSPDMDDIDSGPQGDAVARLLDWLATTRRRWLIVLDDLIEPNDLRGLWPPHSPTGQVLVTTRRRDAALSGDHRRVLDVGLFTQSEALGYLVARLPDQASASQERDDMIGLAGDLERLPLALAQAAAYLADRPLLTCADYRQRLGDRRTSLAGVLPTERELPDEQHHTVAATWSLSIERADRLDPVGSAKPILELMSVLDAAGIPADLFGTSAVSSYLAGRLGRPLDPGQTKDAIGCLYRLSLLSLDTDQPARAVRVHALVQRVTRESLSTADLATTAGVAGEAILEVWPDREAELSTSLRSNANALLDHARAHLWTSNARRLLLLVGDDLVDQHLDAGPYFQGLLDEAVRHVGADHPDTLAIRDRLASCHAEAGEFDRAVTQGKHLLAWRLRLLGDEHVDTLTARHNVARWHTKAGHPNEALAELEELVPAQTKVFGSADRRTLKTRLERAITRSEAGDPANAITELERLLADQIELFGPEHGIPFYTRAYLIHVRTKAEQYVLATAEFEQLIADRMQILAPCERIIPTLEHSYTTRYEKQGQVSGWNIQRMELMIDVVGLPYRSSYQYLLGRYDAIHGNAAYRTGYAIKELTALLADAIYVWGSESPLTLAIRHNLAKWLEWSGDTVGAIVEWELLIIDQLRILGTDHSDTKATQQSLSGLRQKSKDLRPVQLWQRRRYRRLALNSKSKRPKRWPSRAPIDETLENMRTQTPPIDNIYHPTT
ncbi:tetratricopeptide repeat protein [Actinomadura soli]|uniref:tetratricopeptide repeat protein n=1 Tax=Actinomadura soli TaxID=2508997 RepID=UPI0014873234|nr:tetratricopeptide repeat protein [Actinomadura soli]